MVTSLSKRKYIAIKLSHKGIYSNVQLVQVKQNGIFKSYLLFFKYQIISIILMGNYYDFKCFE